MSGNTVNQGKKSNFSAIVLMFVFLIGFIGITIGVNILATKDEQYLEHSGELRVLSQELAKNAVEAAGGKPDAFTQLRQARDNFDKRWGYLASGDSATSLQTRTLAAHMLDNQLQCIRITEKARLLDGKPIDQSRPLHHTRRAVLNLFVVLTIVANAKFQHARTGILD